ncbi:MAG: hypothetical protein HYY04_17390 [Chloroflexi bacterium]|nr:hypothetical protein [Chloroflexota bacterium]
MRRCRGRDLRAFVFLLVAGLMVVGLAGCARRGTASAPATAGPSPIAAPSPTVPPSPVGPSVPVPASPVPRSTPVASATPTSRPAGTPISPPTAQTADAVNLFAHSVQRLKDARSFRFAVEALHRFGSGASSGEWRFVGEGAVGAPNRYRSVLNGQADVTFITVFDGKRLYCADTRGQSADCSLSWGGPGPGTSPYAALAYLRSAEISRAHDLAPASAAPFRFEFTSPVATVAAREADLAPALARVQDVAGEVTVDRATLRPIEEKVTVRFASRRGGVETVELRLRFHDYDQPVDIALPPGAR